MSEHKSFRPSDFSLRDIPGFIAIYLVISAVSVATGLLLESRPKFWSGVLVGTGFTLAATFFILSPRGGRKAD